MSRTPEVIISPSRKFFHDLFTGLGSLSALLTVVAALAGGAWLLFAIVSALGFYVGSSIKYRWVKRGEVGVYE